MSASLPRPGVDALAHSGTLAINPQVAGCVWLPIGQLRASSNVAKTLAQRLMVYSTGAKVFAVKASTDIPSLELTSQRGPAGDRWQIVATVKPDQIRAGAIAGHITVETNDKEFPKLVVPVSGSILP